MRVAIVTTSFPRTPGDGAGHFVEAAARQLADEGDEVHVIAPGRPFAWAPERRGRLLVHWSGGGALFGWPGVAARLRRAPWRAPGALGFALGARRQLARLGPLDGAVAHWLVPSAWPLLAGVGAPLQAVAHGGDVRLLCALPSALRHRIVSRLVRRDTDWCFAAERLRRQLLEALRGPLASRVEQRSRVQAPPLALPPLESLREEARRLRAELDLADGEALVVSAGRLVASKRFELVIQALTQLGRPLRLALVGDGPARAKLEELARQAGVSAVFPGHLPRREALGYLAAADAVAHVSAAEAAPSVVREARALGISVVACPAGDVARWAAEDAGLRLCAPDVSAVATALSAVLGAEDDTGLPPGPLHRHAPRGVTNEG